MSSSLGSDVGMSVTRRVLGIVGPVAVLVLFVAVSLAMRKYTLDAFNFVNPDEAELIAQGRAAMDSFVPFTTWTTATTGFVWVQFLALLGFAGFPMTIAFAHLLSGIFVGLMGFLFFLLLRRRVAWPWALAVALLGWLPLGLESPLGSASDFGALSTEFLPATLIMIAALMPIDSRRVRIWTFVASGLLCGLAVGAKYQALPLAIALLVSQLIALELPWRKLVKPALLYVAAAALPFVIVVLSMVLSPAVSWTLVRQNLNFLANYGSALEFGLRVQNSTALIVERFFFPIAILLVGALCFVSTIRIAIARILIVGAGIAGVFAGGMGFAHYLILLVAAVMIAAALPVRELPLGFTRAMRAPVNRSIAALLVAILAFSVYWPAHTNGPLASLADVGKTLSADSVIRDPRLEAACAPGSTVVVWGWAGELYDHYDWHNGIPFMNVTQLTASDANYDSGRILMARAVSSPDTDCVVDAVGPPFFGFTADESLTLVYPTMVKRLAEDYTATPGLVDCEACMVYVRKPVTP